MTGALLAVPTGVEVMVIPIDGDDGGEVGIDDGVGLGIDDGEALNIEVGDRDTVGMTVFVTMKVKRTSQ